MTEYEIKKLISERLRTVIKTHCEKNKIKYAEFGRSSGTGENFITRCLATGGPPPTINSTRLYMIFQAVPDVDILEFFDSSKVDGEGKTVLNFSAKKW